MPKIHTSLAVVVFALVAASAIAFWWYQNDMRGYHREVISDDLIPGMTLVAEAAPRGGELSVEERAGLIFMREEEKLARDVYLALYDVHGSQVFANIAESEQTHTDAVAALLARYGVADPVVNDERGVYADPVFMELYEELVSKGSVSRASAYEVGAYIEDLDIIDLRTRIAQTTHDDIRAVYENLERGSRNHLRAFNRQIEMVSGNSYQPSFLSPDEFAAIVSTGTENRGGRGGGGRGGRWF